MWAVMTSGLSEREKDTLQWVSPGRGIGQVRGDWAGGPGPQALGHGVGGRGPGTRLL